MTGLRASRRFGARLLTSHPKNGPPDRFFISKNEKGPETGPIFADDRTRTSILLLEVDFESTASTNFATSA